MIKFKQQNKLEKIVYKAPYTLEKFQKLKSEGVSLRIGNQTIKFKEKKEIFKEFYPNPEVSVFNINDSKIGVVFSINTNVDRVFVDFKDVKRFSTKWKNVAILDNLKKNEEKTITVDRSFGSSFKVRVTYYKDDHIQFEDYVYEDPRFKYFNDPPEIVIHKNNFVSLKIMNLERFVKNGYIRIFKKENHEIEKCIYSNNISGKAMEFTDEKVNNHDLYTYRAEVFDNLGNCYKTLSKSIEYKKSLNFKNLEIKYDSDEGIYRFNTASASLIKIEKIDIKNETVDIIHPNIKENFAFFQIKNTNSDCIIHVECFDEDNYLIASGEANIENQELFEIFDEKIVTNSQFQNIIRWNYTGNIDTFIVSMQNKVRKKIIETLPHRVSPEGYVYCVDENYSKERLYTEYVINAVNEFGTIINKKRLIK